MNMKDFLLPLSLALVTVWGLNYFWPAQTGKDVNQSRSGQTFVAPRELVSCQPLNKEVDFIDVKRSAPETVTDIETAQAYYSFSTHGASLQRLEYKDPNLTTIFPAGEYQREESCFLVGLRERTPFFYDLVEHNEQEGTHTLVYQAETPDAVIKKTYTVHADTYKIDFALMVQPKKVQGAQVRIFYPAPIVPDIEKKDVFSAVYNDEKGGIKKTARSSINVQQGWLKPTVFGADERYFLHVLIGDAQQFVQRGYYHLSGTHKLFSILEGPTVTEPTTWNLAFYFGPKEEHVLAVVDPRLEQTLDYAGIMRPLSSFLLYILNLLYRYLYNYGLAIIVLTILVKLLLLPFTFKSEASLKQRSSFDKKLKHIQEKYKHDPQRLAHERAELIKKHGMPGLGGCLPLLLQLPIFIALSRVLSSSIDLYKAPFYFWIQDLSAPDPYYILPLLLSLSMVWQAATTKEKSQRLSMLLMAIIFGGVTSTLPSGLALYIAINAVLGIGQTALARRFGS